MSEVFMKRIHLPLLFMGSSIGKLEIGRIHFFLGFDINPILFVKPDYLGEGSLLIKVGKFEFLMLVLLLKESRDASLKKAFIYLFISGVLTWEA